MQTGEGAQQAQGGWAHLLLELQLEALQEHEGGKHEHAYHCWAAGSDWSCACYPSSAGSLQLGLLPQLPSLLLCH